MGNEDYTGWSEHHRRAVKDFRRAAFVRNDLLVLQMTHEQYELATSHPIFMQVLRLAILSEPRISFWQAQYDLLGTADESISPNGQVMIEFPHSTFGEESSLRRQMWDEAD